jgi:uroporphyrinogen decarboxylase
MSVRSSWVNRPDFVISDCDLAFNHNTMMSPAQYDEFLHPYHQEIVARAHRLGLKIVKHSDGRLQRLIPRFIAEGFDGLHPIQPQCLDIAEIKREFGKQICIMGNIDCAYLLVFGTPEQVRDKVRETIAQAAPGGGYILSSSNTIHPGVKPENYIALVRAAREFGDYSSLERKILP